MKFLNLKILNFKPYFCEDGNPQLLNLYDKKRKDRNITLIVGQNESGKTSISEAIMWCIFGASYWPKWSEWVNDISIELTKIEEEKKVKIGIELEIELEDKICKIIRRGSYDVEREVSVENSEELSIIRNGEPISNPNKFIIEHFPTPSLMEYFIFDADDILKKFEEDRSKTIKENIDKIVGVKKIDDMMESIGKVLDLLSEDIYVIENNAGSGVTEDNLRFKKEDYKEKDLSVEKIKLKIIKLEGENQKLFEGKAPSPEIEHFNKLVIDRDSAKNKIIKLNEEFINKDIVKDFDLIMLEPVFKSLEEKISSEKTSKEDFENSLEIINSTIKKKYSGIIFENENNTKLLNKGMRFNKRDFADLSVLDLEDKERGKTDIIRVLNKYSEKISKNCENFKSFKQQYDGLSKVLIDKEIAIEQIGETAQNKDLQKKYKKYKGIKENIKELSGTKDEIEVKMVKILDEIEEMRKDLDLGKEQREKIDVLNKEVDFSKKILELMKKVRIKFLDNLLTFVNKEASSFIREVVRDKKRFNSINIDSDYRFTIRKETGEELKERQINRGTIQMSMMAFFFGLSKYLNKKIPYLIDNPIIRLDAGNDKRLIEQLGQSGDQLIFHLIPGREYMESSFDWLSPYINTQAWINRKNFKRIGMDVSEVEEKDPERIISY